MASPDSADGCRSAFSELLEFSIDNCEFCSSAASGRKSKMTEAAFRHVTGRADGLVLKIPRTRYSVLWLASLRAGRARGLQKLLLML